MLITTNTAAEDMIEAARSQPSEPHPVRTLRPDELNITDAISPRAELDEATIDNYTEQMRLGANFPPGVAFWDGKRHWLADGFHRLAAAVRCGRREVEVEIREGTKEEAFFFACGANTRHGLPLSNADKRRVVDRMVRARFRAALENPQAKRLSDREIARHIGVSQPFVSAMQKELFPESDAPRSHRNGASHDREDVPEASVSGETAGAATDNGYHPTTPVIITATAQKTVASHTGSIESDSRIAQRLVAHVMGYLQAHREEGVETLASVFKQAVPVIEARIRELETAGA